MPRCDAIPWVPRGLNRDEAAYYIGVGTTKFDEMVRDGRMPRGKRVDGRVIWDRVQLDLHFTELDSNRPNAINEALRGSRTAALRTR